MSIFLGVEIGGTKLQVVAGDGSGRILERRRFVVEPADGPLGIRAQIASGVSELQRLHGPAGIAAGFGGPVSWQDGRIAKSHQVEGWSGFDLRGWLERLAGTPTMVENDSNLAALGEAVLGAGAGADLVFYFNLGSGVGGGLIHGGRIVHGGPPGEYEFGHLRLDREGITVEDRCSGWSIDRRLRDRATRNPNGRLAGLLGPQPGGEAKQFRAALDAADAGAREVLGELAADLGYALSHVVHLMHPDVLVLGGGLSLVGEPLPGAIAEALAPHLMEVFRPGPEIRLARLGEDAVPAGALVRAGQHWRGGAAR